MNIVFFFFLQIDCNVFYLFIEKSMTSNELGRRTPSLNGPLSKIGETLEKKKFAAEFDVWNIFVCIHNTMLALTQRYLIPQVTL